MGAKKGPNGEKIKGEGNLIPFAQRAEDVQRRIRSMGGKARAEQARERKEIAAILRDELYSELPEDKHKTKIAAIVAKMVANLYKKGDIKDLETLAKILGEYKQNIQAEGGLTLNINTSEEGKNNIEQLLNGE